MFNFSLKIIFIGLLLVTFIVFFGYPSYVKYMAKKTIILDSEVPYKVENPPSITIASVKPSNSSWSRGWKDTSDSASLVGKIVETLCNHSKDFHKTVSCIEEKSFNFSEVIVGAHNRNRDLKKAKLWKKDIFHFHYGATYTLNSSYSMDTKWFNSLNITLNPDLNYYMWVHDPHYFLPSSNPDLIPMVQLKLNTVEQLWLYIRPVYHHKLNKPGKPCEKSEQYSYTACIKNSVSKGRFQNNWLTLTSLDDLYQTHSVHGPKGS